MLMMLQGARESEKSHLHQGHSTGLRKSQGDGVHLDAVTSCSCAPNALLLTYHTNCCFATQNHNYIKPCRAAITMFEPYLWVTLYARFAVSVLFDCPADT